MYRSVENPIPRSGLFATMSLEDVQLYIEGLPGKEQAKAMMVFMFTLNACHQLVEDEVFTKEVFI